MMKRLDFFLVLGLVLLSCQATSKHEIDTFNQLLPAIVSPPATLVALIESSGQECLKWVSSRPEILKVQGYPNRDTECSKFAMLQLLQTGANHPGVFITAQNNFNEPVVHIPVRIKTLHRISIVTRSKIMNLREVQEIHLEGFDADDNTFTSLEGFRFKWVVEDSGVLDKVSLKNSELLLETNVRRLIEKEGSESDLIIIKAARVGKAKISVECVENGYSQIKDETTVSVVEKFEINPGPLVYMATYSELQFELLTATGEQIRLPQSYYSSSISNGFTVNQTLFVSSSETGTAILDVDDKRTSLASTGRATIECYEPDSISIVAPQRVIVDQKINYSIIPYTKKIKLLGTPKHLKVESELVMSKDQFVAQKPEKYKITARINSVMSSVDIIADLPVQAVLTRSKIVLPPNEMFSLLVVGGSGHYSITVEPEGIAEVKGRKIHTLIAGKGKIIIRDEQNMENYQQISLQVLPISGIRVLQNQKEALKGESTYAYVIASNSANLPYTQCNQIKAKLTVADDDNKVTQLRRTQRLPEIIRQLKSKSPSSKPLEDILHQLSSLQESSNQLIERFRTYIQYGKTSKADIEDYAQALENFRICDALPFQSAEAVNTKLAVWYGEASSVFEFRVYDQIQNLWGNSDTGAFYLPLKGKIKANINQGPFEWPQSSVNYAVGGKTSNSKAFYLKCGDKEEQRTTQFAAHNVPTKDLLQPVKHVKNLVLKCRKPHSISVSLVDQQGKAAFVVDDKKVIHKPNQVLQFIIDGRTADGHKFHSADGLLYKIQNTEGTITANGPRFTLQSSEKRGQILVSSTGDQEATVTFDKISSTFKTEPKTALKFTESGETVRMLYSPSKPLVIQISGDDSQLEVRCSDSIKCHQKNGRIEVFSVDVGKGTFKAVDRSFSLQETATVNFVVYEPTQVLVRPQKSMIFKGESIPVTMKLFADGQPIDQKDIDFESVSLAGSPGLSIKRVGSGYQVTGLHAGTHTLKGKTFGQKPVQSGLIELIVYPELKHNLPVDERTVENGLNVYRGQLNLMTECVHSLIFQEDDSPQTYPLSISYTVSDPSIVHIQASRRRYRFKGLRSGDAEVEFKVTANSELLARFVLNIRSTELSGLKLVGQKEARVGSSFRVIPLLNDGNSECELEYSWQVQGSGVKLQTPEDSSHIGANVKAVTAETSSVITVTARSKATQKVVGVGEHKITVLSSSAEEINHAGMLVPTNSIIKFAKAKKIESKSPCDEKSPVTIELDTVKVGNIKGVTLLSLDFEDNLKSHLSIQVTQPLTLMARNTNGVLRVGQGRAETFRVDILDSQARIIQSNHMSPIRIGAAVLGSSIARAKISKDSQSHSVEVEGLAVGSTTLVLRDDSGALEIISIKVSPSIEPREVVDLLVGSSVEFTYNGSPINRLVSSDTSVAIVKGTQVIANRLGTATLSSGQLNVRVNIVRIESIVTVSDQGANGYQIYVKDPVTSDIRLLILGPTPAVIQNLPLRCQVDHDKELVANLFTSKNLLLCSVSQHPDSTSNLPPSTRVSLVDSNNGYQYAVEDHGTATLIPRLAGSSHIRLIAGTDNVARVAFKTQEPLRLARSPVSHAISLSHDGARCTVAIDASKLERTSVDKLYTLALQDSSGRTTQIKLISGPAGRSDWSQPQSTHSSWEWTDFLVLFMAFIFVCIFLLNTDRKPRSKFE